MLADLETGKPQIPLTKQNKRNQSIECCRLISAVAVIFIHCTFPGELGQIADCLARFAVPFFFVLSGYFSYQADERTIRKRALAVLKLTVTATLLYMLWRGYLNGIRNGVDFFQWLKEMLDAYYLSQWLINGENPFAYHLWYLSAVFVCYTALQMYVLWWEGKTCKYDCLYVVSFLLYTIHVVCGSFANAAGVQIHCLIYRNAMFFGIPMFSLGIFLREYQTKIIETYRLTKSKMLILIAVGATLSWIEWKGAGEVEMPLGTLIEVIALMLLLVSEPCPFGDSAIASSVVATLGEISACIYVSHIFWMDIYSICVYRYMQYIFGNKEPYLYPIVIALMSVIASAIYVVMRKTIGSFIHKNLYQKKMKQC